MLLILGKSSIALLAQFTNSGKMSIALTSSYLYTKRAKEYDRSKYKRGSYVRSRSMDFSWNVTGTFTSLKSASSSDARW
ncbi:MAG: hypothetical protein HC789_23720 [Microcoleus sp. CSU_2_2]|nr:hypothetical protein [Microcoleus sp. SU_5_3]NJS13163.1 hypothetical protein [Microcoleus sp. CSU_2_2]